MTAKRIWLAGLAVFALLSVIDFAQTYVLITGGSGAVYEANPVADAWLQRHGWGGLAAFKLGAVAVFAGAAALLVVRRPRTGASVMALGCAALLMVTVYSSRLIANADRPVEEDPGYTVIDLDQIRPLPAPPISQASSESKPPRRMVPLPVAAVSE